MSLDANVVSAAVSAISAVFSFYFFIQNRRLETRTSDRVLNIEAQKVLIELEKILIENPEMCAIADNHEIWQELEHKRNSPHFKAQLRATVALKIAMFELAFLECTRPADVEEDPPDCERTVWHLWRDYFYDSLDESTLMIMVIDRYCNDKVLNPALVEMYDLYRKDRGYGYSKINRGDDAAA